jgi:hypothetical protein
VLEWCLGARGLRHCCSGHSAPFLSRFEEKIPAWVDMVVRSNRCVKLPCKLVHSHGARNVRHHRESWRPLKSSGL